MKSSVLIALPVVTLLVACSSNQPPPAAPRQTKLYKPGPPPIPSDSKSPKAGVVHIAEDIRKACGISDADAHFAFDSASLGQTQRPVLTNLATCFVSGPLRGREMRLVGHANPRGPDEYNMVLGGSRADTVKAFFTMKDIPAGRIATTSRGEMEARGTDEATWAEDRRVDVLMK